MVKSSRSSSFEGFDMSKINEQRVCTIFVWDWVKMQRKHKK